MLDTTDGPIRPRSLLDGSTPSDSTHEYLDSTTVLQFLSLPHTPASSFIADTALGVFSAKRSIRRKSHRTG
jgi:hypothetical protein